MGASDLGQHGVREAEGPLGERAVADERDVRPLAQREQVVLDLPLAEVVEDLVARDAVMPEQVDCPFQLIGLEVRNAEGPDLPRLLQFYERPKVWSRGCRLGQWRR